MSDTEKKSARLKQARLEAGYATAEAAVEAFGWKAPGYRHHENGTRNFNAAAAQRYGRAFKVSPAWLLGIDPVKGQPRRKSFDGVEMSVGGSVAAGVWRESNELPDHEQFTVMVPPPQVAGARRFLLRVDGPSMDLVYEPGTILDCYSIFDLGVEPETGDDVIVERTRADGMREMTVKRYHQGGDGRNWLLPRSTSPEFQTPILLGRPSTDHDLDGEQVQVIAFVLGSYSPHARRLMDRLQQKH